MRCISLLVAILLTGCATTNRWQTYHAGPFKVSLPANMTIHSPAGSQPNLLEFESPDLWLRIDFSAAANNFEDWPIATEYEFVKIDGHDAQIGTLNRSFRPGYTCSAEVAFRDVEGINLTISAACKTKEDLARAKKIFNSVRFGPTEAQ